MNKEIRTLIIILFAAFALSSCGKDTHTTDTPDQPQLIGFTPSSETTMVKATTPLADYYDNFGVWGIARKADHQDYVLWESSALSPVHIIPGTEYYKPDENAYWFSGFTYKFIAVAPYADDLTVSYTYTPATDIKPATDVLTFDYSLKSKYEAGDYDFDLMAAAATTTVDANHGKGSQPIIFWHLFSKININVSFVGTEGTIDEIRLSNILTKTQYTLGLDQEPANASDRDSDYPLNVSYVTYQTEKDTSPIVLRADNIAGPSGNWSLHVVPQATNNFDMYLDFTVGSASTTNFKVDLSAAPDIVYQPNSQYNWNIKISPKEISFNVTVTPWEDADDDFEFPIE